MNGNERRIRIIQILEAAKNPVSGIELSIQLGVSRQVVVQDIALLRAVNNRIISTPRGYLIYVNEQNRVKRCFPVSHTTEQIEDELCTIVDHGGKVLDVVVTHEIYGTISADLVIQSRQNVYDFVEKIKQQKTKPLKELTDNIHLHTIEADSEEILQQIEDSLRAKGYLIQNSYE